MKKLTRRDLFRGAGKSAVGGAALVAGLKAGTAGSLVTISPPDIAPETPHIPTDAFFTCSTATMGMTQWFYDGTTWQPKL